VKSEIVQKKVIGILLFSCLIVSVTIGIILANNQRENNTFVQNSNEELKQSSITSTSIEYETVLYRKISNAFEWEWSNVENLDNDLIAGINKYKNTKGAFVVKSDQKECFLIINSGERPSSDYGFKVQDIRAVIDAQNHKECILKIFVTELDDDSKFETQIVDTTSIAIIKINRDKLPNNMELGSVILSLKESN
jgi:hypothetical protein